MERSVAIIGVAGRFPDAPNTDQLHQNLRSGTYSLRTISEERLRQTTLPTDQEYMVRGYLTDIDKFDYKFFGISLAEAQTMDPHQRLFLETVYETIENAGYSAETLNGSNTAVYISDQTLSYYKHAEEFVPTLVTGNTSEFVAARISRQFNLRGGVAVIDTSCSSSLVALHNACNELILGNADQALVGGVNLELFPFKKKEYQLDDVASPDGRSIPFSAQANGMAYGEAVACVLLKPLAAALRDNDHIQAIVEATAVNNNAGRAAGLTAPDSLAQAEVILKAWEKAGITPLDLGFIEAHGSGTQLGDSIEIGGLNKAFRSFTTAKRICPVTTIKSNIGHTRLAAGITGLVKAVLALKHKEIYPSIYTGQPNPHIDFGNSAVYVNEELTPWPVLPGKKRYAAVSAIGFSGTNCHVVLAEAPAPVAVAGGVGKPQVITISAKTAAGVLDNARVLLAKIRLMPNEELPNIAYTLGVGRSHYPYRVAFISNQISELIAQLETLIESGNESLVATAPRLIFLFAERTNVTPEAIAYLSATYPVFAREFATCQANRPAEQTEEAFAGMAFQYAYHQLLVSFGISTGSLLGIGQGKILVDVITGKLTLPDMELALTQYPADDLSNLDQRVQALVQRESTKGPVVFVDMAVDSLVSQRLGQYSAAMGNVTVLGAGDEIERIVPALMQTLYLAQHPLDWAQVYASHTGRRIELPAYQFAKSRVWIRETTTSVEQLAQGRSSGAAQPITEQQAMNSVQRNVATLWKEILARDTVTLDHHFFEIGGNSLQATKVINQVNSSFGVRLSFEDIFDYPTLRQFSECVEKMMSLRNRLLLVWKEVLKSESLQPEDNFFSLGGHSLLANQILNRINKQLNCVLNFEEFYAHPSVNELATYIEDRYLTSNQVATPINHLQDASNYDLSNAQKRLWLLAQTEEGSLAYNESSAYVIDGELNVKALQLALNSLVERHESLRTCFPTIDGEPRQQVVPAKSMQISLPIRRRTMLEATDGWVEQQMAEFGSIPFDLEAGPLLRVELLEETERRHVLLFSVHHIIFDEWSFKVFMGELATLYNAFADEQANPLKPLAIQYRDYTDWNAEQQKSIAYKEHEEYWLTQFGDEPPALELPTDFTRPILKTYRGDTQRERLSIAQWQSVQELGRRNGVGAFAVVMAVTQALLYRYTGQDDIVIGMPVAGREHIDLEDQIGFYANTTAIRTRVSPGDTFAELIQRVQKHLTDAQKHQAYPFDALCDRLAVRPGLSRSPLFDVMILFDVRDEGKAGNLFNGLTIRHLGNKRLTSKFDLTFAFYADPAKGITFDLIYNTDLFRTDTIRRMVSHFKQLLNACLQGPSDPLSEVSLLSSDETDQLLNFAAPEGYHAPVASLHELFTEQAYRRPDAIALYAGEATLTYSTLNKQADAVASALFQQFGVGPGQRVGLLLERSPGMISTILGVLKTGAAYVPILPTFPTERIRQIINDADLSVLITEKRETALQAAVDSQWIVTVSDLTNHTDGQPTNTPVPLDAPACILYTSGSTGKPKGVMVMHRGLVNIVHWMESRFGLTENDVLLQKANYIFDVAAREIFTGLCLGAGLVLVNEDTLSDANALAATINQFGISSIHFTPTALSLFLNGLGENHRVQLNSLKHVLCGGETVTGELVRRYYESITVPLINEYGPTETCVTSSYYPIRPGEVSIPVGKAVIGNAIYVLDEQLALCPVGVWGEICIAGAGVAAGYWNQPEQTMAKFVQNPYATPGFERLYRTGDVGRYGTDGNLEFKGREDNQLKINGYRVELGDIEQTLQQHPSVREVAVIVARKSIDRSVILAYWVTKNGKTVRESELRNYVADRLPAYMVPHVLVQLDAIPLTATGKIDRQKLSEYPTNDMVPQQTRLATVTEQRMIAVWMAVLNWTDVNPTSNFFELGGHSLKAVRILSAVTKEFGVKLTLRDLFANPTIETFSALVSNKPETAQPRIESVNDQAYYELSFGQRRLWALSQLGDGLTAYNIHGTFTVEGRFDGATLETAINDLMDRHESLRTTFELVDGEPKQRVAAVAESSFRLRQTILSEVVDAELVADRLIRQEAAYCFMLEKGPLLRALLIQMQPDRFLLSFTIHHIIADEWSLGVFINEVMALYKAQRAGTPVDLPALRIQYRDYAACQQATIAGELTARNFWLDQFADEVPILDLPTDYARPARKTYTGGESTLVLNEALTKQLNELNVQYNSTLFISLLTTLNVLLHKYTGQTDFVVGTPVAGRNDVDLENQIGYYLNTLALRNQVDAGASFADLLNRIRLNALNAFDQQVYPFDRLLAELPLERDMSRSPLFDVMLVVNNTGIEATDATRSEDWAIRSCAAPVQFSKFDLTFFVREENGCIRIHLNYNADLFTAERAGLINRHFATLLTSVLDAPTATIDELNYIPITEQEQLLYEFNQTTKACDASPVHELFEKQAAENGNKIALEWHKGQMTYAELNHRANQLARWLVGKYGVGPETIVGVRLERSEKLIISILAVLKTGAAFLPIDLNFPTDRVAFMLDDCRASVLIDSSLSPLPMDTLTPIYRFDQHNVNDEVSDNLPITVSTEDILCTIYTSGSTGKPKGTLIRHASLVNYFRNFVREHQITPDDRHLLMSSVAFDLSHTSLWVSLLSGSTLVLFPESQYPDPAQLVEWIHRYQISVLKLTPTHLSLIVNETGFDDVAADSAVRLVVVGGEKLKPGDLARFFGHKPQGLAFVDEYGPTEATIGMISKKIVSDHERQLAGTPFTRFVHRPTIGQPTDNHQVYILDGNDHLQGLGIWGELCIAGAGLASGYLNRPELTTERFVDNPFEPGEIMYRTGDVARWLPDGEVEFMGRKDNQVKLRGYRIETGEIELALQNLDVVSCAVVMVRKSETGDDQLIAYLSMNEPAEPTLIRDCLRQSLPDYMVPSSIVFVAAFPLTGNGKINLKALPGPDITTVEPDEPIPLTGDEAALLQQVVGAVLGRPSIRLQDEFFALGGDSIKAIQIASRLHKKGYRLDVRTILITPRLEDLVRQLKPLDNGADQSPVTGIVPLTPIQTDFFRLSMTQPETYVQSMLLATTNELDEQLMQPILDKLLHHHDALRMRFEDKSGTMIQVNEPVQHPVQLPVFDLRNEHKPEETLRDLAGRLRQSLQLEVSPLLQAALIRMPDYNGLLLVVHHLVIDGVSWRILIEDIQALYEQAAAGYPLNLSLKTDSFKKWSEEQSKVGADTAFMSTERKYWADLAKNWPLLPEAYQPDVICRTVGKTSFQLDETTTDKFLTTASQAYHTESTDLLLTALGLAFHDTFGYEQLPLMLEGHGREEILQGVSVQRTVGWFTSMYPVLLSIPANVSPARHLINIKESLRRIPNKGISYGMLTQLSGQEELSVAPVLLFNHLGQFSMADAASAFRIVADADYLDTDKGMFITHPISITSVVAQERLSVYLRYNTERFNASTMQAFADEFRRWIERLVQHCSEQQTMLLTPSDFGYKNLSVNELESIFE